MLDHVLVRVSDRSATERFYFSALEPLGIASFEPLEAITRWENLGVIEADDDHPVTTALHVGLAAASPELVDAVWRAGTAAGYHNAGSPGRRPERGDDHYAAALLDPDGNVIEAVHHDDLPDDGLIDRLWLGVADVTTAQRFYATIAPQTGFRAVTDEQTEFRGDSGTLALVGDEPTAHLHLAFAATDDAAVRAFHETATAAGYHDNGSPGERPVYADGYYGAFVYDPDGNNVEVVHLN